MFVCGPSLESLFPKNLTNLSKLNVLQTRITNEKKTPPQGIPHTPKRKNTKQLTKAASFLFVALLGWEKINFPEHLDGRLT